MEGCLKLQIFPLTCEFTGKAISTVSEAALYNLAPGFSVNGEATRLMF